MHFKTQVHVEMHLSAKNLHYIFLDEYLNTKAGHCKRLYANDEQKEHSFSYDLMIPRLYFNYALTGRDMILN